MSQLGLELGGIGKTEHVGEARHPRADKGVAEEDGMAAGFLEDVKLAGVEHFDLADVFEVAGALVGAELEDALAFGCRQEAAA